LLDRKSDLLALVSVNLWGCAAVSSVEPLLAAHLPALHCVDLRKFTRIIRLTRAAFGASVRVTADAGAWTGWAAP